MSLSVLVVDDNRDAADTLAELLRQTRGYFVVVAYDGAAALARLEVFRPDIAILDVGLPRISGTTLAKMLRADERFRTLPLLALTAYSGEQMSKDIAAAGFDFHVVKPATHGPLQDALDQCEAARRDRSR